MKVIETIGYPHLCLFSIKDIEEGEEICYRYSREKMPWHDEV